MSETKGVQGSKGKGPQKKFFLNYLGLKIISLDIWGRNCPLGFSKQWLFCCVPCCECRFGEWRPCCPYLVLSSISWQHVCVFAGAVTSFAAGYVKIRWTLWSELVIGVVTAFQAGLLLLMNTTANIWLCYVAYILFRSSYQFLVPIAMWVVRTTWWLGLH